MIGAMVFVAAFALWVLLRGPGADRQRVRKRLGEPAGLSGGHLGLSRVRTAHLRRRKQAEALSLVVLVQQLAALLRGGRGPSRLWEELWLVHTSQLPDADSRPKGHKGPAVLSEESRKVLTAARAASAVGNSPAEAIRSLAAKIYPGRGSSERRVWMELAACLDVAETSGCPLADLLTRFAAQLVAEEDAEAARQTALAGPKATVRLLSWLPVFGLVLGMALGVDPLGILLDNILGVATFGAGLLLTMAGRVWSSRLVASAAGAT